MKEETRSWEVGARTPGLFPILLDVCLSARGAAETARTWSTTVHAVTVRTPLLLEGGGHNDGIRVETTLETITGAFESASSVGKPGATRETKNESWESQGAKYYIIKRNPASLDWCRSQKIMRYLPGCLPTHSSTEWILYSYVKPAWKWTKILK